MLFLLTSDEINCIFTFLVIQQLCSVYFFSLSMCVCLSLFVCVLRVRVNYISILCTHLVIGLHLYRIPVMKMIKHDELIFSVCSAASKQTNLAGRLIHLVAASVIQINFNHN